MRHHLYAAEFANGLVKVGVSYRPAHRRVELQRRYGHPVVRMVAIPREQDRNHYVAESELLNRLRRIACSVERELFASVEFGAAATLVQQMARRAFPRSQDRPRRR